MIDLGLSKLALIGVVALVVVGPERLPKMARLAGTLLGRAQRYINEVKSEVTREMELDELRKMQEEVKEAASSVEQHVSGIGKTVSDNVTQMERDLNASWSFESSDSDNPLLNPPVPDHIAVKAKDFRKKKLARTSAIPSWYKRQSGQRTRVISGAARVARYRVGEAPRKSFH
jgi:sec-independent protein translocase protein TatB